MSPTGVVVLITAALLLILAALLTFTVKRSRKVNAEMEQAFGSFPPAPSSDSP
ncbi:hypothetical protein GCM10022252_75800 [Streptosporangium oxazolinicum]|uniref:LPXTG cell wall anchor domain-containing protein n=1 Tax=Streptosporangium oxazolinicum TaxID=909287 RepID=A0ABP8BLJ1_9ACTN